MSFTDFLLGKQKQMGWRGAHVHVGWVEPVEGGVRSSNWRVWVPMKGIEKRSSTAVSCTDFLLAKQKQGGGGTFLLRLGGVG